MSDELSGKPTTAYWIIAATLLAWNLIGLYFYYQQSILTPEVMADAGLTPQQIAHIVNTPAWGHSGYAIAVNAGVLGAILLLLRKAWAMPLFVLSLIGALVQDLDAMVLRDGIQAWGNSAFVLPVIVIAICGFEIWYSLRAKAKGWLG
jgi:hypothetical protein